MNNDFYPRHNLITSCWDIYQAGRYTGTSFMTEIEAVNYCKVENWNMKHQEVK
jgi:hypothetical protein